MATTVAVWAEAGQSVTSNEMPRNRHSMRAEIATFERKLANCARKILPRILTREDSRRYVFFLIYYLPAAAFSRLAVRLRPAQKFIILAAD